VKVFTPEAQAAIEAGTAIVAGAVAILSDPPERVWSGHGTLEIAGEDFAGIGDKLLAQQTNGAIGGIAQGMTIGLSGVEPAAIELLGADALKGATVIVYRLIFAGDGKTLLDAQLFDRGRVDTVATKEKIGGGASIEVAVESAARGLGRRGGRMRSDSDQRLINALDGYFKKTGYAAEKMLYWGGKRPTRAGGALGGGSGSGGSGGFLGGLLGSFGSRDN
jgi:hypothetical protein